MSIAFLIFLMPLHTSCERKNDKHIIHHLSVHITYFLSAENISHDWHIYLDPTDEPTYQLLENTQDTIKPSI